jgi:hypothetical protein
MQGTKGACDLALVVWLAGHSKSIGNYRWEEGDPDGMADMRPCPTHMLLCCVLGQSSRPAKSPHMPREEETNKWRGSHADVGLKTHRWSAGQPRSKVSPAMH